MNDTNRISMAVEVLADETANIEGSSGEYIAGVIGCPECGSPSAFYAPLPSDAEVIR